MKDRIEKDFIASLYQGEGRQACPPLAGSGLLTGGQGTAGRQAEAVGRGIPYSPALDQGPFYRKDETVVHDHGMYGLITISHHPGPRTRVNCGLQLITVCPYCS